MVLALCKCKCPEGTKTAAGMWKTNPVKFLFMSFLHVWLSENALCIQSSVVNATNWFCFSRPTTIARHFFIFLFFLSLLNIALNRISTLRCLERSLTCPWGPARQVGSLVSAHSLAAVIGPEIKGEKCLWSLWPGVLDKRPRTHIHQLHRVFV